MCSQLCEGSLIWCPDLAVEVSLETLASLVCILLTAPRRCKAQVPVGAPGAAKTEGEIKSCGRSGFGRKPSGPRRSCSSEPPASPAAPVLPHPHVRRQLLENPQSEFLEQPFYVPHQQPLDCSSPASAAASQMCWLGERVSARLPTAVACCCWTKLDVFRSCVCFRVNPSPALLTQAAAAGAGWLVSASFPLLRTDHAAELKPICYFSPLVLQSLLRSETGRHPPCLCAERRRSSAGRVSVTTKQLQVQ